MDELLEQFLIEGRELIVQAGDDCAALSSGAAGRDVLDSAFRAIHTLKGSAAIVGIGAMEGLLHAAEDLLGAARSSGGGIDPAGTRALLACIDQCDRWMDVIAEGGELPAGAAADSARIVAALRGVEPKSDAAQQPAIGEPDWAKTLVMAQGDAIKAAVAEGNRLAALRYSPREDCFYSGDDPLALAGSIPGLIATKVATSENWPTIERMDPYRCLLVIEALSAASEAELRAHFRLIPDQVEIASVAAAEPEKAIKRQVTDQSLRVDSAQIDRLLDIVSELLVARNQFGQIAGEGAGAGDQTAALRTSGAAMDRVLRDLHRNVMAMRMVTLDRLFRRLARMVRETAAKLGREVEVDLVGLDTRIDKALVDALFDPLLHLARNALDHGIELPSARAVAGKARSGRLTLSARSAGQQIVITLSDDGKGIDPEAMRRIAVERSLLSGEEAAALTDEEAVQLVFAAGFSSAAEITDLSGRGVGMDVVKTAVERLGGRTLLVSQVGVGTSVTIQLPTTSALTSVLAITVAGRRYAVPMEVVEETARVLPQAIIPVGTGRAFVLRERTIPFLELSDLLELGGPAPTNDRKVLIVTSESGSVGVGVDDFSDRSEVILRPMTGLLSTIPVVSGTTLLGDGNVLFILNLPELVG